MTDTTEVLGRGDRIELTFPARGDLVVLARLVASGVSARAGFDIDAQSGALCLELTMHEDAIDVICKLERAAAGQAPSPEAEEIAQLSEQILDALVDEHGRESQDGSVRAWLRKRRGGHGA
jgi:hypothetical protein